MTKKVIIFGTGEFAEIVYQYLSESDDHEVVAFTKHEQYIESESFLELPIIPFEGITDTYPIDKFQMFVALGYTDNNLKRQDVFNQVKSKGYSCISYIHPSNLISKNFQFGENCFIFEGNVIQPNVTLQDNVIIWSHNTISHHTLIEKNSFIVSNVGIAGHVTVGENCFIGIGAIIRNSLSIGNYCVIGAGAIILENTNDYEVFVSRGTSKLDISSDKLNNL